MTERYDLDLQYYTKCQFQGQSQKLKEARGILYTEGVDWLINKLKCSWLFFAIVYAFKSTGEYNAYVEIDFRTHIVKKGSFKKQRGTLTLTGIMPTKKLKTAEYDAFDLTVVEPKRCPLRFLLVYDVIHQKHVLMLPSEY